MDVQWHDKLDTIPGFHLLRWLASIALFISFIQIGLSAAVYDNVESFHLGAWWLGFVVALSSVIALWSTTRIAVYVVCIFTIMSFLTGVIGSTIDFYAAQAVSEVQGCTGPDGLYYYGHSFSYNPAQSCYNTYNFQKHDCYCVVSSNSSLTTFGSSATPSNGVTCLMLDGKILANAPASDACSILFTAWGPALYATAYFDVFATIAILCVSVTSCMVLCCPRRLGSCCRAGRKYDDGKFERMPTV